MWKSNKIKSNSNSCYGADNDIVIIMLVMIRMMISIEANDNVDDNDVEDLMSAIVIITNSMKIKILYNRQTKL